ncbi:MAG: 30S ribosomal protein S8, partial [Patescibacteria group bacterium]
MYTDLLIKIKNAEAAQKKSVKVKFTKMDKAVTEVMERFGFLKKVEVKGRSFKKVMEIDLNQDKPILGLKFRSKPSLRVYAG